MSVIISKELKRYNHLIGEINAVYHEMSLKSGLSDSAMNILYTICEHGTKCPLQEICRLSGLSKQTVNSAIRKLESEGIIYLEPFSQKSKTVCLTEDGISLAEQTAGQILRVENDIFASWPREDVENYIKLTEDYLLALRNKADKL